MAILNIGLPKTKEAWQTNLGALATDLHNRMQEVLDAKAILDGTPDADLELLGFTAGEVAYMKTAVADLAKVADAYFGTATIDPAYDHAGSFAKHLRGVIGS
ncbi:MAG: hypothetical protein CVU47_10735 [Chloroflexi bacterium HGW-Chloroflexi-9]|nr:MAG: hypothetical protein CVU47_10735 [Chloroflexi bacterium HGW-Chloroflexi-9]